MHLLLAWLLYLQSSDIEVRKVSTTPTQAVLEFDVPDPSACAVRVFLDEAMSVPAHDSNEALFAGAQACNRAGSVVEGSRVTFVAGERRAPKALDGRFYSRALAADRTYYYQIQSGSRTKLGSFRTANIAIGKLYGEPYPFDKDAPGRYGWPTIDWTDSSGEYVDPITGAVLKRLSSPRQAFPDTTKPADGVAAFAGDAWSDAASAAASDGRAARYSGTANQPLFVRAPTVCPDGWGCERAARWDQPYRAIDDVEVTVKAWCSGAACSESEAERVVELCLTTNGVSCATPWKAVTVPAGSGEVRFPENYPAPLFAGWGAPLARPDMATHEGKVSVDGTQVTWTSGHTFNVGAWAAGSRIRLGGVEYVIARVNDARSLTLESDAGQARDVPYQANNFGLLMRKASASAAVLEVDAVSFRIATSHEYEMPASGAWDFCSPSKVADSAGKQGFLCRVNTAAGYPTLWFIAPDDGDSRFLGVISVPYNHSTGGNNLDGNEGACLMGSALARENGNELYCVTRSNASPSQGLLIFRGRYLPEGKPGCKQPAGYQAIESGEACNIEWELMTRPSEGGTLLAKARAFDPEFDPARYPYTGLFASQGGALGFYAWAGQDSMAWSIWLDTKTFDVLSMQNYHTNSPCRFCAAHSFLEMGDDNYNAVVVKDFVGGTATNAGPYEVNVPAPLDAGDFRVCPADLEDRWKQLGATGVRCALITVSGEPCDLNPSDWEKTNRPACPWQQGAVTLQPIQPGDEAIEGGERFLFLRKAAANQWIVMRNYQVPHGPSLKETTSKAVAHKAGWKLRMACSAATDSGYAWVRFATDKHGTEILRDNGLSRAEHGDVTSLGNVMSAYDSTTDRFGRFFWKSPIPNRVGTPAEEKVLAGKTFGGISVHEAPVFRDFIQTHPSWRQTAAAERERQWYLDGNPFANQSGGNYHLWRQNASPISGSLFKLNGLASPLERKILPVLAWSGRTQLEEISAPASRITGEEKDAWKYCVADFDKECVEGSRAGDVYLNIPSMLNDGYCGNAFYFHRPCFTSMVNHGIGISQYGVTNSGAPDRFLTGHFQRYNATWTYSNAAALPDGSWALIGGSWLEGARNELLLVKLPPYPDKDPVDRTQYVPVKVEVPRVAGATRARLRFGYSENGPADRYFCTSRKEACVTGGQPFAWAGEPQALEACANGCTLAAPAISGRVLHFVVDWFDESRNLVRTGGRGAVAVP